MSVAEFLETPVERLPTKEELAVMRLDLVRLLLVEADNASDRAREINQAGIAGFRER